VSVALPRRKPSCCFTTQRSDSERSDEAAVNEEGQAGGAVSVGGEEAGMDP